jgi:PEP-CTERM motif
MKLRGLIVIALAAIFMVAMGTTAGETADVFPFSGHGTSAGDAAPLPLQWVVGDSNNTWGIPGLGLGNATWPSQTSVTDFHITFTSRTIADDAFTAFVNVSEAVDWTFVINNGQDSSSIDFFAPAGTSLDSGELFFVNVHWNEDASAVRDFSAHWTTAAVPEPASLMLLGVGAVALAAVRRRRR